MIACFTRWTNRMTIACCVHNEIQNNGSVNGNAVVQQPLPPPPQYSRSIGSQLNVFILLKFRFQKCRRTKNRQSNSNKSQFVTVKIDNESLQRKKRQSSPANERFLSEWMGFPVKYTYVCTLCDGQLLWLDHGNSLLCNNDSVGPWSHVDFNENNEKAVKHTG